MNWLIEIDRVLFHTINSGWKTPFLDRLMPIVTNQEAGIPFLLAVLVLFAFFGGKKGKIALIATLISALLIDPIGHYILKPFFARPRPCQIENVRLLVECGSGFSMPSLHSVNIFSYVTSLVVFFGWSAAPLYCLAFLVALSRIYVGVHWPLDTIVGAILGVAVALPVGLTIKKLLLKEKIRDEKPE